MCALSGGTLFFIIPVSILFAISFFVLIVLQKVTVKNLRMIGILAVTLLWIASGILCFATISGSPKVRSCPCPMMSADKFENMGHDKTKRNHSDPMMRMGGMEEGYPPEMMEIIRNKNQEKPAQK